VSLTRPVASWILAGFLAAGIVTNAALVHLVSRIEVRLEALEQSMSTTSAWVSGGITRSNTTTSPAGTDPAVHAAQHEAEMVPLLRQYPRDV